MGEGRTASAEAAPPRAIAAVRARAAKVFLRPDFLLCCAVLGLGCAIMRRQTGSLWPAVILHGGFVVVWQTWLGGVRL